MVSKTAWFGFQLEPQFANNLRFREKYGSDPKFAPLRFYGQEINPATFAMSRMNVFIHDMDAEIALGDTMNCRATHEVANLVGIGKTTLLTWLREGRIPEPKRVSQGGVEG